MNFDNNPPRIGKAALLDRQFSDWSQFLNTRGRFAFLVFLACLGTGDYKHLCAALCFLLLIWDYWVGRERFPSFIRRLRGQPSRQAKKLESEIFRDHIFKRLFAHIPFILGLSTLGFLLAWPAVNGNWHAYLLFLPR